ncbi:hypothetical protein [Roseibium alexandrii]|uniref:Uncharacterized protein n=1 Tax=Roseibium alexandrii TaxID=388408 RepID=A0A0M7AGP4_9HYPH|nr:hypothetical protein [Roseibium alexandrii]CTQ72774.1 hypothetical protein LAX5112_03294 [Roseibium alexandrii]
MGIASLGRAAAKRQWQSKPIDDGKTATDDSEPTPFEQLTKYIPTETITFFVAAIGARQVVIDSWRAGHPDQDLPWWGDPWLLLIVFVILTPLMLWLTAASAFKRGQNSGQIPPDAKFETPWFDMIASTIAFFVWSFSVPGLWEAVNPGVNAIAGLSALVVSWFLAMIEPFFNKKDIPV